MLDINILKLFSPLITQWYKANGRDLPWRQTMDPYKIWLSEIILQQTRVNQGLNYYMRFVEQYPTVKQLASAQEEDLLKLWQGLGYYSRARNIHATAKIIMERYQGTFPTEYKDILALKGVGEYTAAAISSFAYSQAYAVVDGNVFRVLARVFAIETPIDSTLGKKQFTTLATELLDKKQAALHNQAIMEFGAMQCQPAQPDCTNCVLNLYCAAYHSNSVSKYPQKSLKTKQRNRFFNYFYIEQGAFTYINKREAKDVWQNLYELPLIETESECSLEDLMSREEFKHIFGTTRSIEMMQNVYQTKHILSHQRIFARFYHFKIDKNTASLDKFLQIKASELDNFPISKLTELYLEQKS